jgi:uncharacterized membrane protein YagU involved in acid resistance
MELNRIPRALLAGVVATAAMTFMAYFVSPVMLGHPMDIAQMLSGFAGGSWAIGMLMHLMNGIVVFPLIYLIVLYRFLPGAPWLKGILWGVVLWLSLEIVIEPMMGAGMFSTNQAGAKGVMAALVAHLIYGVLLGALTGPAGQVAAIGLEGRTI